MNIWSPAAETDVHSLQTSPLKERSPNVVHMKRSNALHRARELVLKPFDPDSDIDEPFSRRQTTRERPALIEAKEAHKARLARMEMAGRALTAQVEEIAEAARQQNKERAVADAVSIEEVSQLRLLLEIEKARADGLERELQMLRGVNWTAPCPR
eukprot:TRINITY_DN12242_c0_g1_i1.p1 TRINITY_DN12242_c0_g1~~TRINITY_DN12242_c0_g1_i1.p1  ORF type:complete len:155 (+),score=37.38 TRINITY_DN12242_c0_g1_i1:228-692(+)